MFLTPKIRTDVLLSFDEFVKMWKKTAFCVDFFDVIKEYKISVNCCKIGPRYDIMTIQ